MEFLIIGIVSSVNLIVIVHKFRKGRTEDGLLDSILFALMASMFSGSYGGMVVAMIASLIVSLYLLASPPTFFRNIAKHDEVVKALDELKSLATSETKNKKVKQAEDLDFD